MRGRTRLARSVQSACPVQVLHRGELITRHRHICIHDLGEEIASVASLAEVPALLYGCLFDGAASGGEESL